MSLRDSIESIPEEDFAAWCETNLADIVTALVDGDATGLVNKVRQDFDPDYNTENVMAVSEKGGFIEYPFFGRVSLQKSRLAGSRHDMAGRYEVYYGTANSDGVEGPVGSLSNIADEVPGFQVTKACEVKSISFWTRQTSSNANHQWAVYVYGLRRSEDTRNQDFVAGYRSPTYQFLDTNQHLIHVDISGVVLQPGDQLTIAFERVGTQGSNRYQMFVGSGVVRAEIV